MIILHFQGVFHEPLEPCKNNVSRGPPGLTGGPGPPGLTVIRPLTISVFFIFYSAHWQLNIVVVVVLPGLRVCYSTVIP